VTEEVSGIDLVREMFRIADGEELGYGDPPLRGHSIEFRVNAEDPGRNFLPAPGTITDWRPPSGPGVRLDAGYGPGMTVPQAFDSLIAKLIVTGASRDEALARARRALAEFEVGGMPTVLPFHRAVVRDPAFTGEPFAVHTRWIETEYNNELAPYDAADGDGAAADGAAARERITVEVGGKRLEVTLPAGLGAVGVGSGGAARTAGRGRPGRGGAGGGAGGDDLVSPMQGTIVKIVAADGEQVSAGDTVVVLEAMKMEQPLTAHKAGTVAGLSVQVGQTVPAGEVICQIRD
jgi:acetyl-CoA/propionyl-CoA carboxylase biotin carboxyl carrier protein